MQGERDLTAAENLDRVSREEWSIAASEALIQSVAPDALAAIAAGGFSRFLATSRPVYAGHGFQIEDYQRMFDRIKVAADARAPGASKRKRAARAAQSLTKKGRIH
jgi:hypothetical protein